MMLEGVRIVDLTTYVPGPFATHVLAELGAHVIHVESPTGDPARNLPDRLGDTSALHAWLGAGKTSVTLDLKSEDGHSRFLELVADADVVVEGFTPGVAARLGVDDPACRAVNVDLVYCSISGSGQTGPYAATPAHDINLAARAGILDQVRDRQGEPVAIGPIVADMAGSLFASVAILSALVHRQRSGDGRYLDVSLLGAAVNLAGPQLMKAVAGRRPAPAHDLNLGADPAYRAYRTRDGRHAALGALEPRFWERFCTLLDRPDLISMRAVDPRRTHEELEALFAEEELAYWNDLLADAGVCFAPLNKLADVLSDPHVVAAGALTPIPGDQRLVPAVPIRHEARGTTEQAAER